MSTEHHAETKKPSKCMLCAKPSEKSICAACSDNVRSEALDRKKKQEKKK